MTLLEAPEPPSRLPSNSLLADSLARLVSAATVEAVLAVELAVELELLLALATELAGVAAAWLLLMLPIDITVPIATAGIRDIGRDSWNLSDVVAFYRVAVRISASIPHSSRVNGTTMTA